MNPKPIKYAIVIILLVAGVALLSKITHKTDTEEIMENLQEIVKNFTDESQQYIIQLSDYLIQYFII